MAVDGSLTANRYSLSSVISAFDSAFRLSDGCEFGSFALRALDLFPDTSGVNSTFLVGGRRSHDGMGSIWLLLLNSDNELSGIQDISFLGSGASLPLPLDPEYADYGHFGAAGTVADFDGDKLNEILIGAPGNRTSYLEAGEIRPWDYGGAVWLIGEFIQTTSCTLQYT